MIRGYLLSFGLLQLAAVLLRASGLTHMPWAAILAPLWIGPALLIAAVVALTVVVLLCRGIAAVERAVPIDDTKEKT